MSRGCRDYPSFAGGLLDDAQAALFRQHLGGCDRCQRRLTLDSQMEALIARAGQGDPTWWRQLLPPVPAPAPASAVRPAWRRPRVVMGTTVVAAAAAAMLAVWWPRPTRQESGESAVIARVLQGLPERTIEPRLAAFDPARVLPLRTQLGAAHPGDARSAAVAELLASPGRRAVATGVLLSGEGREALRKLEALGDAPDVVIDRAAAALLSGEPQTVIGLLDALPEPVQRSGAAEWNRALALRDLGLTTLAAEAFARVAALGEPGWSADALARQEELRRNTEERRDAWPAAIDAGEAMTAGAAPIPTDAARRVPGTSRLYLYHALHTAGSRARVLELDPLARALDGHFGGSVLRDLVTRTATADFRVRAPLALRYLKLEQAVNQGGPAIPEVRMQQAEIDPWRRARQDDLVLGGLALTDGVAGHQAEFAGLADRSGDPWWVLLGQQAAIDASIRRGQLLTAEQALLHALPQCHQLRIEYRCGLLEHRLADLYILLNRPVEARRIAATGLEHARAAGEWGHEALFLQDLATAARYHEQPALARAYFLEQRQREAGLTDPRRKRRYCTVDRNVGLQLAQLSLDARQLDAAFAEISAAPPCGQPLTVWAADVYSELARWRQFPIDVASIRAQLGALRQTGQSPGERVWTDLVEGRLVSWAHPEEAAPLLRRAIAIADRLPGWDFDARRSRARSFNTLMLMKARAGAFADVLTLLGEEAGLSAPGRCAVGVGLVRGELFAVLADAAGSVEGRYREADGDRVPAREVLGPALWSRLAGCEVVDVLARPPFQATAELLPSDVAWRFRVGHDAINGVAAAEGAYRVIVAVTNPPAGLGLPALSPFRPPAARAGERQRILEGRDATPRQVLAEIERATEVEFYAHGLVDLDISDVSFLALSPDVDSDYALTAGALREHRLKGAPMVVLASCRAAAPAPYRFASWSLPVAFIDAGARAVLASLAPLMDDESRPFFDTVMAAVKAGTAPAVALRDARVRSLGAHPGASVANVVLFE